LIFSYPESKRRFAGHTEEIKMKKDHAKNVQMVLVAFVLITTLMSAAVAQAEARNRKGLFLGFNAGWGSAGFSSQHGDQTLTDDPFGGAAGGLRFGYAFSNSFALSLEGYGFGTGEDDDGWGLGAGFLTVTWFPDGGGFFLRVGGGAGVLGATWWPDGSGFFLRIGGGAGGGDILLRDTGELLHFEDKGAVLFGLGYEFQLTRKFALGIAFDAIGFDLEGASGLEEDVAGMGVFSIQFNWYL